MNHRYWTKYGHSFRHINRIEFPKLDCTFVVNLLGHIFETLLFFVKYSMFCTILQVIVWLEKINQFSQWTNAKPRHINFPQFWTISWFYFFVFRFRQKNNQKLESIKIWRTENLKHPTMCICISNLLSKSAKNYKWISNYSRLT